MLRSTFAVVAAAFAAPTTGTKPARAVAWTAIPPPPAGLEPRFTDNWHDPAWTSASSLAAVTKLTSAATPLEPRSSARPDPPAQTSRLTRSPC